MTRHLHWLPLVVATVFALTGAAGADDWTIETVSTGQAMPNCSISLDPFGAPCVAFNSGAQPNFARRDGGQWITEPLTTPPAAAGDAIASPAIIFYVVPSLAFDPVSGGPRIAYVKEDEADVWYAERSGSGWSYERLSYSGEPPLLAFDAQGKAHVVYRDYVNGLLYRTFDGVTWTSEPIPGEYGVRTLQVDASGQPHVTLFQYWPNSDLLYAKRGPGGWTVETVDTTGSVGGQASMVLDAYGQPRIAYVEYPTRALRYAERSGSGWTVEPVGSLPADVYASLALAPGGQPFIAFCEIQGYDLRLARRDQGVWSSTAVDTAGSVGRYCSMTIDASGRPHIAYSDLTNARVRYATRSSLVTGVEPGAAVRGWGIDRVAPNPASSGRSIELALRAAEPRTVGIELLDLAGRVVARTERALGAGLQTVRWDPGAPSAGLYFIRARFGPGESAVARLAILR
jgi:hypothetical protein